MRGPEDIEYALESTRVLLEPDRRIDTFGVTKFEFHLLSEPMDSVNQTRLRIGKVEAEKPQLIRPSGYEGDAEFEGFGEQAREFFKQLCEQGNDLAVMRYGFRFSRSEVSTQLIEAPLSQVSEQVLAEAKRLGNPLQAVIAGVDDVWEACVLRFTLELIQQSMRTNEFDFRRKGWL